jgi:hypothetical protein
MREAVAETSEATPDQELLARQLRREKEEALQERASRSVRGADGVAVAFIELSEEVAFVHLSAAGKSQVNRPWNPTTS